MIDGLKSRVLNYHHRTSRVPCGERVSASLIRHIGRAESLLDVGCGDGGNTERVAERVGAKHVVGVDIVVRPSAAISVQPYDGTHLPFPDKSFDAVTIVDVLHHCKEPRVVLREVFRVARKVVAIKDHFKFGPVTNAMLYAMDLVGNAKDNIFSPGTYFEPAEWIDMIAHGGGRVTALDWPLRTHDLPWSVIGRPQLQFTMRAEPLG
jgi:SAM-dependent methyltransferase